jgi:PilZ domain
MVRKRRIFVEADDTARFVCPVCDAVTILQVPRRPGWSTPLRERFRCCCGRSHIVYLEHRVSTRREVCLPGAYRIDDDGPMQPMTVYNLSRTGLAFEIREGERAAPGTRVVVELELTHAERTRFVKEVLVSWVEGRRVGAEFWVGEGQDPYDPRYDLALAQLTVTG